MKMAFHFHTCPGCPLWLCLRPMVKSYFLLSVVPATSHAENRRSAGKTDLEVILIKLEGEGELAVYLVDDVEEEEEDGREAVSCR